MIAQLIIALTGFIAIWLVNDRNESRRKWAPVIGLLGQPFWLIETWNSGQIGMLLLSAAYTVAWLRGFRQHWVDGRGIRWSPKRQEMVRYPWKRDGSADFLFDEIKRWSQNP